ncbi:MAG: Do family serine endopeptidase [Calditrichia bacterium]
MLMDFLKKVVILIVAAALVAGAVYIIHLSQLAQKERQGVTVRPGIPKGHPTPAPLPLESDTFFTEIPEPLPDSTFLPDSIIWHRFNGTPAVPSPDRELPNPNNYFVTAAQRIIPAVVTLENKMLVSGVPDDENHKFFREKMDEEGEPVPQPGSGSGIIISANGYILTNYHVVEKAVELKAILSDRREYDARYIGGDPNTDIAVLKIEASNLPVAYFGNSDSIKIGEWVMAVGSPLNFSSTITAGIVSALGRDIRIINQRYGVEDFIQTDAVINPGNSGGALVNLNGEVIGINTAIATRTGLYQGYGFAIPVNLARKVVDDILRYGHVRRGLLGVEIESVNGRSAKALALPSPSGVLIQRVVPGSPAEKAGVRRGDVVLKVEDTPVYTVNTLQNLIARHHPGDIVKLTIWRDRRKLTISVKLGMAPVNNTQRPGGDYQRKQFPLFGLTLEKLSQNDLGELKIEHGLKVSKVDYGSPADEAGIGKQDIILEIADLPVSSIEDFEAQYNTLKQGDVAKILIRRFSFTGQYLERLVFVEKK